jgi:hypothetical protein
VYAALGDSYAAGPLIPNTEANSGCFRSDHNYASLLAADLHITTVRDVTCSAAETVHVRRPQHTLPGPVVPPQQRALTADADLVTIGIGGNDFGLFSSGLAGTDAVDPSVVRRIGRRVASTLSLVHRRAPSAQVVLVGYPRLVDPDTSCPKRLPFSTAELALAYDVQARLNEEMRNAADQTGTTYVDLFKASEGHGICAKRPWVNGQRTVQGRAVAYHPFEVEMRAAALEIEKALD